MGSIDVQLDGMDRLSRLVARVGSEAPRLVEQALVAEAGDTMLATKRVTPVAFGNLRDSGMVQQPRTNDGVVSVELTFGGASAPYAVYVHERTDLYHAPPTKAKFLEETVLERVPNFQKNMARNMLKIVRG